MTNSTTLAGTDLLTWRRQQLARGGAAADLDWLIDLAGGVRWTSLQRLLLDPARTVALQQSLEVLSELWQRHLEENVPLQHLAGLCPWRDLLLESSPAALIPRQETELLVDLALNHFQSAPPRRWADLGTGSGAIAVSLVRAWPTALGHGVDLSADALRLAERNLQRCAPHNNCSLHLGSWWTPLRRWWGTLDLVISNPPYIPRSVVHGLDAVVRDHEPHLALSGGEDGLDAIRTVVDGAPTGLSPGGWLLLEHHHDQSGLVMQLMRDAGLVEVSAAADLEGTRRFALARNRSATT
ncbi:N5-glutamine S-adenosyl-L-methionine-dependent methyltransferase [Synechococcus sp. KORDI-52]|uniref:peptide chain release factor N(5)-glutamine methyltransferase n=1 Tax=Synechococcus sp. KORDI-52 TaxID=585425 RepID=UPI0004E0A45E|nr:peptide chain release factor N(5)-glutamine methyltransferase [Synechococcus sp. KORDI-52]AII47592.1 N5-glutamine S-adenosyl-L-methionine-dependent methyltransferase [Synechococcus sp. KORDI-52]